MVGVRWLTKRPDGAAESSAAANPSADHATPQAVGSQREHGAGPSDGICGSPRTSWTRRRRSSVCVYQYRFTIELVLPVLQARAGLPASAQRRSAGDRNSNVSGDHRLHAHQPDHGPQADLRTYEMICYYFIGWADEDELLAHLAKLKTHDT